MTGALPMREGATIATRVERVAVARRVMPGLYLAHGAERAGEPEVDETAEVRWVPVDETPHIADAPG
jgi:hypothetical protein